MTNFYYIYTVDSLQYKSIDSLTQRTLLFSNFYASDHTLGCGNLEPRKGHAGWGANSSQGTTGH